MLDYEGQVTIVTKSLNKSTASLLTITSALTSHSGNYTCWPTLAKPTSVLINVVLEGESANFCPMFNTVIVFKKMSLFIATNYDGYLFL